MESARVRTYLRVELAYLRGARSSDDATQHEPRERRGSEGGGGAGEGAGESELRDGEEDADDYGRHTRDQWARGVRGAWGREGPRGERGLGA